MREKEKKEKKKEQNHTIRRSLLKGKRNSKLITDMEYYLTERLIQLFQVTEMKRGWLADFDLIRLPFPLLAARSSLAIELKRIP